MNSLRVLDSLPSFLISFVTLSYPVTPPSDTDSFHHSLHYSTGILDVCLIISCIAVMALLRDITRIYLMEPFAKWKLSRDWKMSQRKDTKVNGAPKGLANGSSVPNAVTSHKNGESAPLGMPKRDVRRIHRSMLRFAEQGWSVIYYTVSFLFGIYVHRNLPTRLLHPIDAWLNYPHVQLAGTVKFYYLTQIAFYLHQVLILNAEARRKDHVQMMAHHIITIILIVASYAYNFTRIGCLILVLMDCSDIFLPLAKMLRYIGLYTLCDATFTVFLVSWLITRHVLFIVAIKSTIMDPPRLVSEPWAPERGSYLSPSIHGAFCVLLVLLQVIQIVWFGMICRVAYRVVSGQGASDDRSDEDEAADEGKEQ